jgi:Uma2 family endonuclease
MVRKQDTSIVMIPERTDVTIPADHIPGPKQGNWTYEHYAALPDDGQRYEIVDGVLYMTPAPNRWHQHAVLEIATFLHSYIQLTHIGEVYIAPFDVRLRFNTVVQPDMLVVLQSHLDRVTDAGVIGAPDLVVEVASPGTATHDRREKYDAYAQAGLPEYWIADPATRTVEVRVLDGETYRLLGLFKSNEKMRSTVVPRIEEVSVDKFFATA